MDSKGLGLVAFLIAWIPFLASDQEKKLSQDLSLDIDVITNEFCGYERFMGRCNQKEVIIVRSASFGRMRAGKCVTGDYSHAIGCSSDVTNHVSNMCTGRQNCSFLVAMMDSVVQPCAKDFKSYLEASYVCRKASFLDKNCGEETIVLTKMEWSGYLAFNWRHLVLNPPHEFGTVCTWRFTVEDGRRVELSWLKTFQDIPPVKPTTPPRSRNLSPSNQLIPGPIPRCPLKMWVFEEPDNEVSISACQDISSRHRTFYTSLGSRLTVRVQLDLDPKDELVSFFVSRPDEILPWQNRLLHFKVIGCPKVEQSGDQTAWQHGDSAAVVCASSGKTWYLTCRQGKWIGFVGNCSKADHKKLASAEASNMAPTELSNGAVMAVLVGVVTGFAIGMLLLFAIVFTKRSYRKGRNGEERKKKLELQGYGNNYLTMSAHDNNGPGNSFIFKQLEDRPSENNNDADESSSSSSNNNNNNSHRLLPAKIPRGSANSDPLCSHAKAPATPSSPPLLQTPRGQSTCLPTTTSTSEPIKRRSKGNYHSHGQCPNLPDFLSTYNSPDCAECCCLCSANDNFLLSVSAGRYDDFRDFSDAMQALCNCTEEHDRSFVHCSKLELTREPPPPPLPSLPPPPPLPSLPLHPQSSFIPAPMENVRSLSHPKHEGAFSFGKTCQFSVCPRLSPNRAARLTTCECNPSMPTSCARQSRLSSSSGRNSQCALHGIQDGEVGEQTKCGNESFVEQLDGNVTGEKRSL